MDKFSPITCGVPQGGLISPILYCLYVQDFQLVHNNVIIPYKTVDNLQDSLNRISNNIEKYMVDRGLVLNRNKTEILLFVTDEINTFNFMKIPVNISHSVKFLGIFIENFTLTLQIPLYQPSKIILIFSKL